MTTENIKAFAVKQGYDDAEYLKDWQGYKCYEPILDNADLSFMGLPLVILVKGEQIRMSTPDEALQI